MASTANGGKPEDLTMYKISEVVEMTKIGRTMIFEQIRLGRLRTVRQGRVRLITAAQLRDYIQLLEREAEQNTEGAA